jgi:hypothetical protein
MSKIATDLLAKCAAPAAAARIAELEKLLETAKAETAAAQQTSKELEAASLAGQAAATARQTELEQNLEAARARATTAESIATKAQESLATTTGCLNTLAAAVNLKPEQVAGKTAEELRTAYTAQLSAATIEHVAALGLAPSAVPTPAPSESAIAELRGLESVRAQFAAKLAAGKN